MTEDFQPSVNTIHMPFCPKCGTPLQSDYAFCPQCAYPIKDLSHIGIGKQIYIYFASVFLPPAGLVWFFKFMRSPEKQVRIVGNIAGALTIISLIITIWITVGLAQQVQTLIHQQLYTTPDLPAGF